MCSGFLAFDFTNFLTFDLLLHPASFLQRLVCGLLLSLLLTLPFSFSDELGAEVDADREMLVVIRPGLFEHLV